jgi:hypothetical protein
MDQALLEKRTSPHKSVWDIAAAHGIPSSTLHNHLKGTHGQKGCSPLCNLSVIQEEALITKINEYADRGTLLTPRHISELAQALCGHAIGKNWTSTFIRRHKDVLSSRFYRNQEVARLKADTAENRQAFYALVSASAASLIKPMAIGQCSSQARRILRS